MWASLYAVLAPESAGSGGKAIGRYGTCRLLGGKVHVGYWEGRYM